MTKSEEANWQKHARSLLAKTVATRRSLATTVGRVEHVYSDCKSARERGMSYTDIATALSDSELTLTAAGVEAAMRRISFELAESMPRVKKVRSRLQASPKVDVTENWTPTFSVSAQMQRKPTDTGEATVPHTDLLSLAAEKTDAVIAPMPIVETFERWVDYGD